MARNIHHTTAYNTSVNSTSVQNTVPHSLTWKTSVASTASTLPVASTVIANTRTMLASLVLALGMASGGSVEASEGNRIQTVDPSKEFVTVVVDGKNVRMSFAQIDALSWVENHLVETMSDEDWDRYETYLINIEKQLDADIAALEARTAAAKQRIAERAVQIAAAEERIAQHETDIAENQRIIDQSRANTAAMQAEIDAIDKETQAIVAEITHKAEQLLTLAETDPSVLDHPDTRAGINMIITSPSSAITPAMRERARKVLIKNGYQLADN